MKELIALHQCHYDGNDGKRMVADPGVRFETTDEVAEVLIQVGAAHLVTKDEPVAEPKAKASRPAKGRTKDEVSDDEGSDLV